LRKGRAYRRCDEIVWGFHLEKATSRDTILYDLPDWQIREYGKAMNTRISRSKSSLFLRILKKTDVLESLYWVCEKIGLSFIVVYFDASISLGNYNMLEKRLFSICGATSMLANHLFMEGYEDEWLRQYFELVDLGMKEKREAEARTYAASLVTSTTPEEQEGGLEVELRDVSFVYPTESQFGVEEEDLEFGVVNVPRSPKGELALRNFNFKFERGKMYSIVGQNGAGKTTLVQLLSCLYAPTHGTITVNGKNILDYDPTEVRSQISVLFQDFSHFEFLSARESIEIGNLNQANRKKKAESLAAETGVTDFIPLDTVLFDISGVARDSGEAWRADLSGGQWQKIGLARSFMRDDASLLILDEPTSALDVEAENHFFNQILQRRRGKTTIFITHKFNTTRSADCILFIKEGRVWESGTHEELLKLDGEYARLYKIQSEGYTSVNS
jgi:ABC-type multidrug transport system fused ATPase/permease subunit